MQKRQSNKTGVDLAAAGTERRRLEALETSQSRRESVLQLQRLRRANLWDSDARAAPQPQEAKAAVLALQNAVSAKVNGQETATADLLAVAQDLGQLASHGGDDVLAVIVQADAVQALLAGLQLTADASPEVSAVLVHVLTFIVAGDQRAAAQCAQGVPLVIQYLQHPHLALAERCAALLGSLAEGNLDWRLALAHQGSTAALAALLVTAGPAAAQAEPGDSPEVALCRTACWALANSVRSAEEGVLRVLGVPGVLPALLALVAARDVPLCCEAAWAVAGLTTGPHEAVQGLLEQGVVQALVRSVHSSMADVAAAQRLEEASARQYVLPPLLRALSNMVATADPEAIQAAELAGLEADAVHCLGLAHRGVLKEAALLVASLARQRGAATQRSLLHAGALPALVLRAGEGALDLRREAASALLALCLGPEGSGDALVVASALEEGDAALLPAVMHLLRSPDYDAARVALQLVELVLRLVKGGSRLVEEADGIDALEQLQYRGPPDLQERAGSLVDSYYGESYGLEDPAA